MAPDPVTALAERIGAGVELERPSDAEHGDYATNAAMKLAGARRQAPRELAAELAETALALPEVERAEIAGPGFVNLFLADAWFGEALGAVLDAGAGSAAAGAAGAARPGRDGLGEPDGAAHVARRATARTATPSRGCSRSPATT